MLENNRDEINFHKFLKSVRSSQGVSLERVALGICSKSGMSRVESGNRLPEKLVRDRLTARLGISGEEYEEYLLPNEYEQWEGRMEIIRAINKKNVKGAEKSIKEYNAQYNTNPVEAQFVAAMKFMVYQLKGCSEDVLRELISEALECTISDMDAALGGAHLLADQELNIILEYVRLKKEDIPGESAPEWRLHEYDKVINYVANSRMDKIAQAKVYSKTACFVSELVLTEYMSEESLRYALELCTSSIEILRDTVRLYYFVELNEYRAKLIEKLRTYVSDETESKELEELYHTSKEWAALFHELYTENDLPVYMENFTHLYTETECNNVRDVIRARRAMMGMTQEKFSGRACDKRTLQRIEWEEGNSSITTMRELFDRIGICAEYKRARVITSNADMLYLSRELVDKIDRREHEAAIRCINELTNGIDMDIAHNEQELRRLELIITRRKKKISNESLIEELTDVMECTLSMDSIMSESKKYLTRSELSCVHDFALYTTGEVQVRCRKILEKICLDVMSNGIENCKYYAYELIICKMFSLIGNEGKYEESTKLSKIMLKESLRNYRMNSLMDCLYNELWNHTKQCEISEEIIDINENDKSIKRCYMLSVLARKTAWEGFFQQKMDNNQ